MGKIKFELSILNFIPPSDVLLFLNLQLKKSLLSMKSNQCKGLMENIVASTLGGDIKGCII